MTASGPILLLPYAAVPGSRMLFAQPPRHYGRVPPALYGFDCDDPGTARLFLGTLTRQEETVPLEAVMAYRDMRVMDGRFLVTRDGAGVRESFADAPVDDVVLHRHPGGAAGEAQALPAAGPPVVALFTEHGHRYGPLVREVLPRLVHLAEAGLREVRLLLPHSALPLVPVLEFALAALGMRGEAAVCPEDSVVRVPELVWATPVARYPMQSSPTLLRLMERLRAAAGAGAAERPMAIDPDLLRDVLHAP